MDLMSNKSVTNRSVPACTVIPVLVYEDLGQAVDFLCHAFGFTERLRVGTHRAQLVFGDGAVIVSQRSKGPSFDSQNVTSFQSLHSNEVSHSVHVQVDDVDHHHNQAREHGARILHPPADHIYGERQYTVEDLGGHLWTFSQSIADVDPEEWGAIVAKTARASLSID
jgi:uncharacterized glyoxalase superfamily protein PhnB